MKRPVRHENAIQADIVGYLRLVLAAGSIVYANANASRRTASGRAGNAVPGLLPGIPDLTAVTASGLHLYFEVKTEIGRTSEAQECVISRLRRAKQLVAVVRSIDDVKQALLDWQVPTREAA